MLPTKESLALAVLDKDTNKAIGYLGAQMLVGYGIYIDAWIG